MAELMELGIVETYLTQHALVGDASNAEPQTSPFMKDGTSDWHILRVAWVDKRGQDYVFGCFKGNRT